MHTHACFKGERTKIYDLALGLMAANAQELWNSW